MDTWWCWFGDVTSWDLEGRHMLPMACLLLMDSDGGDIYFIICIQVEKRLLSLWHFFSQEYIFSPITFPNRPSYKAVFGRTFILQINAMNVIYSKYICENIIGLLINII